MYANFRVICNRNSSFRCIFLCYSQIYFSVWNVKNYVNIQNTKKCSFLASSWFHGLKYAWCLWVSINSLLPPLLLYLYFVYTLSQIVKQSEQTRLLRNVLKSRAHLIISCSYKKKKKKVIPYSSAFVSCLWRYALMMWYKWHPKVSGWWLIAALSTAFT